MAFADLASEVAAEFGEFQDRFADSASTQTVMNDRDESDSHHMWGFRFVITRRIQRAPKTQKRREYCRAWMARNAGQKIARAILAGERPKSILTGRGRPPARWLRIAEELGIDLRAPVAPSGSAP